MAWRRWTSGIILSALLGSVSACCCPLSEEGPPEGAGPKMEPVHAVSAAAPEIAPPPTGNADTAPVAATKTPAAEGMIYVPAGTFTMGTSSGEANEGPAHPVTLNAFFIDTFEVRVADWRRCIDAGACVPPQIKGRECGGANKVHNNWLQPGRDDHPVNCVDWDQASAFCAWAGKRLPTEAEWERAARGTDERRYTWGNEEPDNSTKRLGNFADKSGQRSRIILGAVVKGYDDGYTDTAPVGQFKDGVSPVGAHDMAGNVSEWVADRYDGKYYASSPPNNPKGPDAGATKGDYRVIRGASWVHDNFSLPTTRRALNGPRDASFAVGLRCAKDAP